MPRIEPNDSATSNLPVPLDVAAEELESLIERRVREIVDAAHQRAAEIEREATAGAQEIKRGAEREAQGILEEAFNRAWRILDGIDLLESGVGDLIGALRAEMEGFAADLGSAVPAEEGRLVPRETSPPSAVEPPTRT
jgi:flagellar biosynthesis/type III secretory pathway protein FliH